MIKIPSVWGSGMNFLRQSTKFVPLKGSPPIPTQVDCPRPTAVVWKTWIVKNKNMVYPRVTMHHISKGNLIFKW